MNYEKAIKEFIARNACHNGYCDSCFFECRIATKEFEDELRNLLSFATAESDKYRWHDLRKDPTDLPTDYHEVVICLKGMEHMECGILIGMHNSYSKKWGTGLCSFSENEIVAWREKEPFEEVEE